MLAIRTAVGPDRSQEDSAMSTGVLHVDLPESLLLSTGQSREEFIREAKLLLAVKLFELGRLSSGRAAELCSLPRLDFLLTASRMGVPVADLDEAEMEREFSE
jgi:predicted HTH domain antitoxin